MSPASGALQPGRMFKTLMPSWLRSMRPISGSLRVAPSTSIGWCSFGIATAALAPWRRCWTSASQKDYRSRFLLLTAGDPATLSPQARENLLAEVTARIAACERIPVLDIDSLRRYSRPDLADAIRTLWDKSASHPEVQRFLLRLIWLGEIKDVGPSPWRTRVRFRLSDGRVSKAFGMRLLNCSSCSISAPTVRK